MLSQHASPREPRGRFPHIAWRRPSLRSSFAAFAIFVCCVMTAACIVNLMHARAVAVGVARREAENLAQSLARQDADTFEAVDGALLALAQSIERNGTSASERDRLRESMAALVTTMPRLHGLSIVDASGRLVVSNTSAASETGFDFADEPYVRYHRTHPGPTMHISGPGHGKTDSALVLYLTRRLDRADGGFAGVAIASIALDYFEQSYGEVDIGRSGAIALIADDGRRIVSFPPEGIGRTFPAVPMSDDPYKYLMAASYIGTSPIDGVRRLNAFRRLDRYPLEVTVGLAESEYLAMWRADAIASYVALALGTALIGFLASGLVGQINGRRKAESILARLSPFDALTGLVHRRRFDEELEREWRRAARDRTPLGLLLIVIDNLKAFNDYHGHEVGDDLLIAIARTISTNIIGPGNIAGRFTGLQFAVVLPTTDEATVLIVGEGVRRALAGLVTQHESTPCAAVSINIGAVSAIPGTSEVASTLVHAAELAVRTAKTVAANGS
jgi:diguanylate cyclase (GGDEF)-like protein